MLSAGLTESVVTQPSEEKSVSVSALTEVRCDTISTGWKVSPTQTEGKVLQFSTGKVLLSRQQIELAVSRLSRTRNGEGNINKVILS